MIFKDKWPASSDLRKKILEEYHIDETKCLKDRLDQAKLNDWQKKQVHTKAKALVKEVRAARQKKSGIDAFMAEYDLSTAEGVALMCIAEAMLRIPDKATVDNLIKDKIAKADWAAHSRQSDSLFVNATTWGLMLSGHILSRKEEKKSYLIGAYKSLVGRLGEPVIRKSVKHAMKILGKQFVMGRTINEGVKRARKNENKGYLYSYDMLGEAARTQADADKFFDAYKKAIEVIGEQSKPGDLTRTAGISIKLSALHPRYEFSHREICLKPLSERLTHLALLAKDRGIGLTVDAEEAYRLDISLDIIEAVATHKRLIGWDGFGLAVQAYQKRAFPLLDWLADLARRTDRRMMVRLVKGAYWDTEIKLSQVDGFADYPVFTRKAATDVSYIACAKKLIENQDVFYPQFATHNAHTVAVIMTLMGDRRDFEFQCLHGMGDALYDQVVGAGSRDYACRIYAPVGSHEELLPYLVRRLLENGANSSFVNRIVDDATPIEAIIADPMDYIENHAASPHPRIPKPRQLYKSFGENRLNSKGIDLTNLTELKKLETKLKSVEKKEFLAGPNTGKAKPKGEMVGKFRPADNSVKNGVVTRATKEDILNAIERADKAYPAWNSLDVKDRAAILRKVADLFEMHMMELMGIAVFEAGKTLPDAVAEVREAIDFCRYYTMIAEKEFEPKQLPGPTGEDNRLILQGRGVMVAISPWNFPLAIFTGQVIAPLACGNTVIAKPAEQTPFIAARAVELMHEAGVPKDVLQLIPGKGREIGEVLLPDERVQGVLFTGSTETAGVINRTLAARDGAIVPLIAETGGQNSMIVDSSALPEQVVQDVINSAFRSAGQRCSALRVLFLQEDIADHVIEMLKGAMAELVIGDPGLLKTDVGPVIDHGAKEELEAHTKKMKKTAKLIYQVPMPSGLNGSFFAPCAFEIDSIDILEREVFGPILHVVRYKQKHLDKVIDSINNTGYGLTCGVHTRIHKTAEHVVSRLRAGNAYVNRDMIGAVVGVQPFGGEGLSGTGPKAGGPHYLFRLCKEKTVTVNTAAAGGNASLMSLSEDD